MDISEFTQEDKECIERNYAVLREAARKRCGSLKEMQVVQRAFEFANSAHNGVRRRSGEPYIIHPISVALIVVNEIGLGYKSIAAALLHDVVEDTDFTVEDIRSNFGDKIASLVDGLTKIKTVLDKDTAVDKGSLQAENLKRVLLTLNDDARVVLIKLADRLHNCRTISSMPDYKKDKILSETMFIFIPLAYRLGLYNVKTELEDIWLRNKEPQKYKEISERLQEDFEVRKKDLDDFIEPLRQKITDEGFSFEIQHRVKTPYSIWRKMNVKGVKFNEIYDLYAIRIIFEPLAGSTITEERQQCFQIYSAISAMYPSKDDRLRDWIAHPKSNGYEALHCTLMSAKGNWIEVQIRSRRMNDIAEKGIAAHWNYKRSGFTEQNELDMWLGKVKEILTSPDVSSLELLDIVHNDLVQTDIIVFTPTGEQVRIPKNATVLDFAFQIHTEVGMKAIAGKVNMKLVALSQRLASGDQIEIITAQDQKPQSDWLNFVITRKAKSCISDYLKSQNEESSGAKDSNEVQEAQKPQSTYRRMLNGLMSFGRKTVQQQNFQTDSRYKFAMCCNPIPGDSIIAFNNPDGTVTIHKRSCEMAGRTASTQGERIIPLDWREITKGHSYLARISLKAIDRVGLLNDISRYVSLVMSISMKGVSLKADNGIVEGSIDLFINDTSDLEKLIDKLSKVEGIESVTRTDL